LLLFFLLLSTACTRDSRYSDPEETFQRARLDFIHGHLIRAQEEAGKAYQRFFPHNPEWGWRFRLLQGEILIWRGLSQDALSLLDSQLPFSLSKNDLQIKKYLLESLADGALRRLPEADQRLQQAALLCTVSGSELTAEVRAGRGILEVRRGKPEDAKQFFREALELARTQNNQFVQASALLNLSFAAVHQRQYDEAIDWSNRAYQVAHALDSGIIEEKALGNLGWSYYILGDFDRSLALSQEAETRAHDLGIVKDQARWLYNLGVVYYEESQFRTAEEHFQMAFDLANKTGDQEQMKDASSSLAFVALQQGNLDAGEQYSQRTSELAQQSSDRAMELYALFTSAQISTQRGEVGRAKRVFQEISQDHLSDASLRWQAQNELAILFENENRAEAERQYRNALSTLECARDSLRHEEFRLPFLANAAHVYDDYIRFLVEQGKADDALQAADYSRAQTLSEGLGLLKQDKNCAQRSRTNINPQQAVRTAGGPVLFYWLGQRQSYLWVVGAKSTNLVKLPPAAEIEPLIQNYRKALLDPADVLQTRNQDGIKLYDILVAPAQKFIPPNSRVTIIADGSLNNLNFETLLVPEPKPHYWIEDVTVTNASSLRMLTASRASPHRNGGRLLLIGDPVVPEAKFPPLPSAKIEMQDIEKHFVPAAMQVFSGSDANPGEFFKSKPESFSYIHFVAHGTASQLSPLDSAVILSKATTEEDSYKLHARDIIAHPLHADLAVISTCYGSGTTLYNGEGLVGLSWAFLRAGTHNVIGALWEVSDASTPQLMDQLYGELRKGRSPQDALRTAKLSLIHSDGAFRKPIYWAPFQLYTGS
jgi:CHAT domain-containing protein